MPSGQITGEGLVKDSAFQVFQKLDDQVIGSIKNVDELERRIRSALSSTSLSSSSNQSINAIRRTNTGLTEQEKVYRQLAIAKERNTQVSNESLRQLVTEREKRNQLTRELREEAKINTSLEGSYKRLRLERDKAGRTLRDLIVSEKASNKELERAQREFDRLDGRVKKADRSIRNFRDNVGNYSSGLKPLIGITRELIGVFGIVEGIRLAFNFGAEASELAKQAKGVEFAFVQLGNAGVKAFDDVKKASNGAISDLDIKRSLVELNNFNISLEQAGVLFEFLTVRSLQTGQSIDKLRDSLVEGLSKESLLRIDNLGISTADLNEQLQKTPDFVEAVAVIAQREVAKAGNVIDEASNSSEALSSEWENFTVAIGQTINQFKGLSAITSIVRTLSESQQAYNVEAEKGVGYLSRQLNTYRLFTASGREENRRLIEESRLRKEATQAIQEQTDAYIKLNGSIGPLREGQSDGSDFSFIPPEEDVRTLAEINKELEKQRGILQEGNISSREEALVIQNKIEALEKEAEAILGTNKAKKTTITILSGTVAAYQEEIKELTQLRDTTAKTTEEYEAFNQKIFETEQKIKTLTDGIDKLNKVQSPITRGILATADAGKVRNGDPNPFGTITSPDAVKINEGLTNEIIRQEEKKAAIIKSLRNEELADFKDFTDQETEILKSAIDQQQQLREKAVRATEDLIFGSIQAIFDARVSNIDEELQAQRDALDETLQSTEASEKQKLAAEKKFAEQEKKLLAERQKREKQAFLVQQGIAVAQIAIDLAKTIASIQATAAALDLISFGTAGTPYRAANIPIAIATAAAQTGLVLAQSIPAFFKGKNLMDNYEGPATWGERRKEVKIGADGSVEVSPNKTTPLYVKKDDIITPSIDDFNRRMKRPNSEVYKRVSQSLQNETDTRTRIVMMKSDSDNKAIEMAIMKGFRKAKIHIHNPDKQTRQRVKSYL